MVCVCVCVSARLGEKTWTSLNCELYYFDAVCVPYIYFVAICSWVQYQTLQFSHWLFVCLWYWWKKRMSNINNSKKMLQTKTTTSTHIEIYREIAFNNTISTNQRLRGHIEIKKNHTLILFLICVLCLFLFSSLLFSSPSHIHTHTYTKSILLA